MVRLNIKPTEFTPKVLLDAEKNKFEIAGESRPEDAGKFYEPILKWLDKYHVLRYWKDDKYRSEPKDMVFEFKFEYFNSTTAKYILDILIKLNEFHKEKKNVTVKWCYEKGDIDMQESGERFSDMLDMMHFEFVEISSS